MRKRFLILLSLVSFIFLFVACGGEQTEEHVHSFDSNWISNDSEHWHAATCGCDIKGEIGRHEFDGGKVQKEPTEFEAGLKVLTCLTCGYAKEESIPALGHEHKYSRDYKTSENTHWFECSCGEKTEEASHQWDAGTVLSEPTPTIKGQIKYTCTVCKYEKIEEKEYEHVCEFEWKCDDEFHEQSCSCGQTKVYSERHTYEEVEIITPSTETVNGTALYECSVCHHQATFELPLAPHEHKYSDTWSYDEYGHYKVPICGHPVENIDYAEHTFDEGVITIEPTVDHEGEKKYSCDCGYSYTEVLPQHYHTTSDEYGHDDEGHWVIYTCGCDIEIVKNEHNYWLKEVVDSTVDKEGLKTYECMVCKYIKTETIPVHQHSYITDYWAKDDTHHWREVACGCDIEPTKIEHDYKDADVYREPTCSEPGKAVLYCECGKYIDSEVPATGEHNLKVINVEWTEDYLKARELMACDCGYEEYTEYVEATVSVIQNKVYCTDEEVTKYSVTLSKEYTIEIVTKEATEHSLEECIGQPVSCESIGWDPYVKCNNCEYTTYEEIPATGHDFKTIEVEATCYDRGYAYNICLNDCGYVSSNLWETPALGHELIRVEEKKPTCEEDGWPMHYACTRCSYKDRYINGAPATGHQIDTSAFGTKEVYGLVYEVIEDDFTPTSTGIKADHLRTTSFVRYEIVAQIDITFNVRFQYNYFYQNLDKHYFNLYFNQDIFNETTLKNPDATSSEKHNKLEPGNPTEFENWSTWTISLEKGDKATFILFFDNFYSSVPTNEPLYYETCLRVDFDVLPYDYLPADQFETVTVQKHQLDKLEPLCEKDVYCVTCEQVLVPAKGHDWVEYEGLEPTCLSAGYKPYHVCNKCEESSYEDLPFLEHEYEEGSDNCKHCGIHKPTEGLLYELTDDQTAYKVVGIDSNSTDKVIYFDNHYNNKVVQYIDGLAFKDNTNITKIVVPETVEVKNSAFYGCSNLKDVILYGDAEYAPFPYTNVENVTCTLDTLASITRKLPETLKTLTLLDGEELVYTHFEYLENLEAITLPATIKSIGRSTFFYPKSLKKVDYLGTLEDWIQIDFYDHTSVPSTYTKNLYINGELVTSFDNTNYTYSSINDYAFYNLESLTEFVLGQETEIGINSLKGTKINTLTIGETITDFNKIPFAESRIENISLDSKNDTYRLNNEGALLLKDEDTLVLATTNVTSIDGISKLTQYSFIVGNDLEELTINEGVVVESGALVGLNNLVELTVYSLTTYEGETTYTTFADFFRSKYGKFEDNFIYYDNYTTLVPRTITTINLYGGGAINEYAFLYCSASEINILGNYHTIYEHAFESCGVIDFVVPDTVTYIGYCAFKDCHYLESITLPFTGHSKWEDQTTPKQNNLGYLFGLFSEPTNMVEGKYYAFPEGLKEVTITGDSIKEKAFEGCYTLETINLTGQVNTIDKYAFYQATNLKTVNIPETVKNIYDYAFSESGITEIVIPASVEFIGYNIFENAIDLETVEILSENIQIGQYMFAGCTSLKSVTYPETVTSIGLYAFKGCTSLELADTVSSSITSIGSYAFADCTQITEVNILNATFGSSVFANCPNINTIHIGQAHPISTLFGTTELEGTYSVTLNSTTYYIPNVLTTVSYEFGRVNAGVFAGLSSITSLDFGNVTYFARGALRGLSGLEELTIPYVGLEATSLSSSALFGNMFGTTEYDNSIALTQNYNASNSMTCYIPESLKVLNVTNPISLQYGSLSNLSLDEINIDVTNLTYIDGTAFLNTTGIQYTNHNNGVYFGSKSNPYQMLVSISDKTITSFEIHDNCLVIMDNAFDGCTLLESIVIPDTVTKIGAGAFSGCIALTEMTLPYVGESVDATGEKATLGYIFGTTANESMTEVTQYYSATESKVYYLPSTLVKVNLGCEELKYGALYGCSMISEITFDGLKVIGEKALALSGIVSLEIPETVTSIGAGAFAAMLKLESLVLPFVGSKKMDHEVDIPSAESLFGYVFGTEKLSDTYLSSVSQKYDLNATRVLNYVPSKLKSVTVLGGDLLFGAFYGMSNYYAGASCEGLNVTLGKDVTYIGDYAFAYCLYMKDEHLGIDGRNYGLTDLTINGDLEYLGSNFLNYSYLLQNLTFNGDLRGLTYSENVFDGHNPTEYKFINPTITFLNPESNSNFYTLVENKYSE